VPVTTAVVEPPLQVKLTFVPYAPVVVGLNCATTVWLPPGPSTNGLPESTLNGPLPAAVPLTELPPEFLTVNERSADPPTATDPKSWVEGVTNTVGAGGGGGGGAGGVGEEVPEITFAVAARIASMSAPTSLPSMAAL